MKYRIVKNGLGEYTYQRWDELHSLWRTNLTNYQTKEEALKAAEDKRLEEWEARRRYQLANTWEVV